MSRVLRRVLVANRGEIARRVFATARAMGISTVAVFSDADAGAAHVREADLAVRLPGSAATDTYLRADLIVEAALRSGADCVHPGYGFLSEDAGFARAVTDAGLVFVGPGADAIEAMGDKLRAKALMAAAGVPTLPSVDATGLDEDELADAAAGIGFPVLVKAAHGGGGRGMREVREPAALAEAVAGARREAAAAFGDGTVFLERLVERGRHVEVQVFGDALGNVTALFERECSIQRRHQKVLEEAPSPAVDEDLRARLHEAATRAAAALSYVGAGTVELLLEGSGEFWFLEVNTRLQVEHPVTEAITGLDLVRLQLEVAAGRPLPPEALQPTRTGHALEVRLYAEDPAAGYLPQAGTLARFEVPHDTAFRSPGFGIRLDSGVRDGDVVSVHYDPMLAKLVSWAPDRTGAALALAGALTRARLHGVATNRDLLVRVLRSPEFLAGDTDTGFLLRPGLTEPLVGPGDARLHAVAAALAGAARRRGEASSLTGLPAGWRNNPTALQRTELDTFSVGYRHTRDGTLLEVEGGVDARLVSAEPDRVVLEVGGVLQALRVERAGDTWYVDGPDGATTHVELPRFPDPTAAGVAGSLTAAMPGTVTSVPVALGQAVSAGQTVVVLEAMKMEHPVRAPAEGTVALLPVEVGAQVDTGTLLAVLGPAAGAPDDGVPTSAADQGPQGTAGPGQTPTAQTPTAQTPTAQTPTAD